MDRERLSLAESQPIVTPITRLFMKVGSRVRRRRELQAPVLVTILSGTDGRRASRPIAGTTLNLSETGALLSLTEIAVDGLILDRVPGDGVSDLMELDVDVRAPEPAAFSALAKVIWLEEVRRSGATPRHHLVGVRFVKLYKRDQESLARALKD
jgi:hypothetical protein